jgi:uncharacterized Zn finger protein (UPF0148 family)
MNDLACRACRKPLLAKSGCGVCDPIRKNLVVLGETEEERPSLAVVSNEAVNALRSQLRDYKTRLAVPKLKDEDRDRLHDRQRAVSGALSKLLDAARKIQGDGIQAVERMSFAERAKLFCEWYMTLPAVYRESLRKELDKQEERLLLPAGDANA